MSMLAYICEKASNLSLCLPTHANPVQVTLVAPRVMVPDVPTVKGSSGSALEAAAAAPGAAPLRELSVRPRPPSLDRQWSKPLSCPVSLHQLVKELASPVPKPHTHASTPPSAQADALQEVLVPYRCSPVRDVARKLAAEPG